MKHLRPIEEKKPKGAPDWHDSDAPDANGRFRDLSIKDLAAWLIKTRKKDVKRISGSLTQQIVFNRNDDPKYAEKMEKTRKEVYKQLGREDLLESKREDVGKYNTVKKVIAKLGRRPSEQELATFINNNYYDVTEVERGDDDPRANDKIADLVAFYKFDIDDWQIAWADAQNESVVTEAKDNLYLQLHKKYAEQIKGLKAKKIKKLTDLVSVQRWSMEDREDYFDMNSKKKKELSAEYDEERKLFKKYMAGDESVMLPKGTEALAESSVTEGMSKERMIKQIERALKDGLSIFKLPMATQTYYRKHKSDFETVEEGNYKMEDIYDLIAHHRFDKDFEKLSSKDKEWVKNDAKERGFNESLLESDMFNMYYSLIDELYEAKPGPDAYMTGLSDEEKEEKEAKMKKQADMDDDDPDSYEELPGDEEAREKGKVKKSKHTTAYNKKFKGESMKNLKSFDNFVTEKRSDLWSPYEKADILAGDMFGAMGLYRLEDDELDQIIDLKKADKLAKKMFGEFGFKTLAAKEMEELLDNNPKLLRESVVNEAEMPKKYIGNDDIVFLKTKEDSRGAHYNLYYKGHDIEAGGARFGSEKELEDFAANYILSNQWYKKLKYEDSIPLPEAFVGPFVFNDRMSDEELLGMYNGALDGYSYYAKGMQYPKSDYKKAYQEIEKILKKRGVDINEAKLSTVHRAAKKGSYPAVVVVVQDGKVIHQEPVSTPEVAPATFNVMQKKYPKALLHLEDKTGKRLFSESVTERFDEYSFKFGKKSQYGVDDVNLSYGFWGTLELNMDEEQVSISWEDAFDSLVSIYKFTDEAALYYLNSKAGRHLADKFAGGEFYNLEDTMEDYANKGQWKKWAKEYAQFAEEDNMEEGLMIRESKSDMDEYYRELLEAEQTTNDQSPLGDDGMETGIKNKAKESGVPVGLLRIIMRRGLAAWKTGHRPGATQAQWGYARVNSFLTKQPGTWGKADSDIAKKVRDGGHDKNL